ncbi:OLC1v1022079C1 [Oldenlandia corymbosa var. corymbosa]|uniref:OLC1v1022079C1 n=1 Tax=Oldenlandia corymbosa var. corymbosa TaxID=529605 RepID=A0AAV1BX80_OLDCO|nr:OLC1v1022079C1 [Oldenlandia corymbosa var. corymbosa]
MAEEFQESEVIFQDYGIVDEEMKSLELRKNLQMKPKRKKLRTKQRALNSTSTNNSSSVPVNIPEKISWFQRVDPNRALFDDDADGEMEPPHVIIGRRIAGKIMAFSVCTGNGRTLKGRDLSEVRNSILRMTGFLET